MSARLGKMKIYCGNCDLLVDVELRVGRTIRRDEIVTLEVEGVITNLHEHLGCDASHVPA